MIEDQTPAPGLTIEIPIRWGDMDAFGHVNNIVFFQYCESARIAYFDAIDIDQYKQKPTDNPALATANLNFRQQLRYPGTVAVTANATRIGKSSLTFAYTLRDKADGSVAADGDSVIVWVDYEKGAATPLPDALVNAIADREQNPSLRR